MPWLVSKWRFTMWMLMVISWQMTHHLLQTLVRKLVWLTFRQITPLTMLPMAHQTWVHWESTHQSTIWFQQMTWLFLVQSQMTLHWFMEHVKQRQYVTCCKTQWRMQRHELAYQTSFWTDGLIRLFQLRLITTKLQRLFPDTAVTPTI